MIGLSSIAIAGRGRPTTAGMIGIAGAGPAWPRKASRSTPAPGSSETGGGLATREVGRRLSFAAAGAGGPSTRHRGHRRPQTLTGPTSFVCGSQAMIGAWTVVTAAEELARARRPGRTVDRPTAQPDLTVEPRRGLRGGHRSALRC